MSTYASPTGFVKRELFMGKDEAGGSFDNRLQVQQGCLLFGYRSGTLPVRMAVDLVKITLDGYESLPQNGLWEGGLSKNRSIVPRGSGGLHEAFPGIYYSLS